MIFLGGIELRGGDDLGHDGLFEAPLQSLLGFFRELLLGFIMIEDGGAILVSEVAELPVGRERIDVVPEGVEQFLVADFLRILGYPHGLGVAGAAGNDLVVGRVLFRAAGEARHSREYAFHFVEKQLHRPETSADKSRLGGLRAAAALRRYGHRIESPRRRAG